VSWAGSSAHLVLDMQVGLHFGFACWSDVYAHMHAQLQRHIAQMHCMYRRLVLWLCSRQQGPHTAAFIMRWLLRHTAQHQAAPDIHGFALPAGGTQCQRC
jgi:hypothetical protein